jgi:hypothetical protein
MRVISLILVLTMSTFFACKESEISPPYPDCIKLKIEEFKSQAVCETGYSISQYKFQGKIVYAFSESNKCMSDAMTYVVDSDCKDIGYLGSIDGSTKINGVEFMENATLLKVIWQN